MSDRTSHRGYWISFNPKPVPASCGVDRCDLRTFGECACAAGECHQQPKMPAPLLIASLKDIFAASIVLGAIATFIALYSIPAAVKAHHDWQLENQENVKWRK